MPDTTDCKARVLVVDDDESVRRALKRLLLSVGVDVKVFASAQELLDDGCYENSLLILDIQMPEMDGFELQKVLAASNSNVDIIFITAHENPKAYAAAMKAGAVAFLQKPFNEKTLLEAIHRQRPGSFQH